MSIIGNYKPYQVFIGDEIRIEQITSLNSLCDCDIHMILIISYMDIDMGNFNRGFTFHIYKELNDIRDITQDYIYIKINNILKNENLIVAT